MNKLKLKNKTLILVICLLSILLLNSCNQPVLEPEQCIASRDIVKKFYSFHFGNEISPTLDGLEFRKKFLSNELLSNLENAEKTKKDYFTQTDDYPKAFRAGGCVKAGKDKALFEILLFWRKNETNIQREIEVEVIEENGKWLVNKVTSKE